MSRMDLDTLPGQQVWSVIGILMDGLAHALPFPSTPFKAFGVRKQEFDRKHPRFRTIGRKAAVMIAWHIKLATDNTDTIPYRSEPSEGRLGHRELLGNTSILPTASHMQDKPSLPNSCSSACSLSKKSGAAVASMR
jgi:hypothetical protein